MASEPDFDLGRLLKDIPRGAWVAISHDQSRVVAYSADINQAIAEANSKGEAHPRIIRVPETEAALVL